MTTDRTTMTAAPDVPVPPDVPAPPAAPVPPDVPAPPAAPAPRARAGLRDRLSRFLAFAARTHAPHQAAVVRIGFAAVFAAYLLREWPNRRVLYGDRSPWAVDMAAVALRHDHGLTVLTWSAGRWWFEAVYTATLVAALLLMLGWHTRLTSVLFMIGVLSLENRNTLVGDGGDNVIRIMVIYLVFTRCAQVWSLDARRTRRHGPAPRRHRIAVATWTLLGLLNLWTFGFASGWAATFWTMWALHGLWYAAGRWFPRHRARALLDASAAMLHNAAVLVIAVQVCLIYSTAGWYKIQGSRWEEGSALYYALHLDYFTPWPGLAALLSANALAVLALSYGTVMVQVAFPFTLANRKVKNVLLAAMMLEHAAIAVILGIPFLSLAMIVCDAVFLPTAFLLWTGTRCTDTGRRIAHRLLGVHARLRLAVNAVTGV
ncbi:HTTM domain-containing protein [Streptomyces sp. NPDC001380]|uniref:HTTM domain-containing protein n=1 Tax=Streptomyces sp. NPDC001380 TaxID=3364566 RepID=UPI0036B39DFB